MGAVMSYKTKNKVVSEDKELEIKKPVEKKVKKVIGIVNVPRLNVRKGPGYQYSNVTSKPVILQGTEVEICQTLKDWYEVKIKDLDTKEKCFVAKEFIIIKK